MNIKENFLFRFVRSSAFTGSLLASIVMGAAAPALSASLGSCDAYCIDAGDFYVYYGNGLSEWEAQVGTYVEVDFEGPTAYTQAPLTVVDNNGVELTASLLDTNGNSVLDNPTVQKVTSDGQHWVGLKGDDHLEATFTDAITGFSVDLYLPAYDTGYDPYDGINPHYGNPNDGHALQLTIGNSTFTFDDPALNSSYDEGWISVGIVAESSYSTMQWSVEGGDTDLSVYEGWDMKNLKVDVPEPFTTAFATALALGFGILFQKQSSQKHKKDEIAA